MTSAIAVGAAQVQSLFTPQAVPAGARNGVYSLANYGEDLTLGRGPDWPVVHRIFGNFSWRAGTANNQGLWRFGDLRLG
jgi:hypothetical protein